MGERTELDARIPAAVHQRPKIAKRPFALVDKALTKRRKPLAKRRIPITRRRWLNAITRARFAAMLDLRYRTPPAWLDCVLASFDEFLVDHAACERKASALGMALVVRYPDRPAILDPLIEFAREELLHFHQVYRLCASRGLKLAGDEKDPYVTELVALCRHGRDDRLLDRLLVAGVIEARGCERLEMLAGALTEPELADFYRELWRAEARHHGLFVRLARELFAADEVQVRLETLLVREGEICERLEIRPRFH